MTVQEGRFSQTVVVVLRRAGWHEGRKWNWKHRWGSVEGQLSEAARSILDEFGGLRLVWTANDGRRTDLDLQPSILGSGIHIREWLHKNSLEAGVELYPLGSGDDDRHALGIGADGQIYEIRSPLYLMAGSFDEFLHVMIDGWEPLWKRQES